MAEFDDDEQHEAFERALEAATDFATFIAFADIVGNYEDTARPPHDDIEYDCDFDGAEFDNTGEPVSLYGIIIYNFENLDDYPEWDEYPEGWISDQPWEDEQPEIPLFRFPLFDPRKPRCTKKDKNKHKKP